MRNLSDADLKKVATFIDWISKSVSYTHLVIIGHSQFEKIPISAERQERQLREQIDEIENALAELKFQRGENFTIKQMEKTRKSLETRLEKLLANDRKDDVVTFEQLGVDRLYVDESLSLIHISSEYWADYKKPILDIVANSFLEEYDEYNIEVAFKTAVANSVSYACLLYTSEIQSGGTS